MTAIPPLGPLARPLTQSATAQPESSGSESFESMLDDAGRESAQQKPQVFSFAELGMFGRHGAQSIAGIPAVPDPAAVAAEAAPAAVLPEPLQTKPRLSSTIPMPPVAVHHETETRPAPQPPLTQHPVEMKGKWAGLVSNHPFATRNPQQSGSVVTEPATMPGAAIHQPSHTLPIAPPQAGFDGGPSKPVARPVGPAAPFRLPATPAQQARALTAEGEDVQENLPADETNELVSIEATPSSPQQAMASDTPAESVPEGGASTEAQQLAPPVAKGSEQVANTVNLLVSGSGDAVSVVVRSADSEDGTRLRRMVEETASEFGVDVKDFQLNGSAVERTTGGTHGGRAR